MVIVHSYVKVYQRVVSSWGLKANGFLRLANGHDGAMAVVEPDPYQWMRSQLLALTGIMFVKVLELLFCYLYLLSRLRERERSIMQKSISACMPCCQASDALPTGWVWLKWVGFNSLIHWVSTSQVSRPFLIQFQHSKCHVPRALHRLPCPRVR